MSSWKSLSDVYVPNTGGDITGDLEVSGNLTVNDGSGEGTTYDVASEITDLKSAWDSVSQDYIVERITWANPDATNEVYNIEKWASGFCRISGMIKYTYSLSVNNAYGGLYYTSCSGITMPPYLTDVTYANLQIQHGSGLHGASIYAIASDFSYFSFFLYSATSMTVTPIVHICFEGKWK